MSSRAGSRPRTRASRLSLSGGGAALPLPHGTAARPLTRARQRGYYSEIAGPHAAEQLGNVKQGPQTVQNVVWKSQRDKHLPSVAKFTPPDDFLEQLKSQEYGPTTLLIPHSEFSDKAWEPKVQIPFVVDSGCLPRKVEIERRKREYAALSLNFDQLLKERNVDSQELVPITDRTSKALLNFSKSQDGQLTPTFPSFLPLETFDNTEFDCRTPEEWLELGLDDDDGGEVRKPIPGKALLSVLDGAGSDRPSSKKQEITGSSALRHLTPTPPPKSQRTDAKVKSFRKYKSVPGTKSNPLPPLETKKSQEQVQPDRQKYEWVDIGVLDYNPSTKLYLVKRVTINIDLQECEIEALSRQSVRSARADRSAIGLSAEPNRAQLVPSSSSKRPDSNIETRRMSDVGSGSRKGSVGISDAVPASDAGERVPSGRESVRLNTPPGAVAKGSPAMRSEPLNGDETVKEGTHYWVPRVRVMFAAEDPRVFANRVAHAHMTRQKTEALLRYNLYVDCMPCDGLQEIDRKWLNRMMGVARSMERLKQPRMDSCASALSKEVQLEYTRTMGKILFDKTVTSQPGAFPFVTLPDPHEEVFKKTGMHPDVPTFPFQDMREKFQFLSLTTSLEAIRVLEYVRVECGKVCALSLFHTGASKHLKLDEFDQTQQQATTQTQVYLKDTWVPTLRSSIKTCLDAVSKGWYNMAESNFEVYQKSKLKKLMELISSSCRGFSAEGEKTQVQIRAEIDNHLKEKAKVESTVPQNTIIGPFFINMDPTRLALAKKHKDIALALLEYLANHLRKITEEISEEFKEVSYKLRERTNTIEDLTEQKKFIKGVPDVVSSHQSKIDQAMSDYDMIDDYYYTLSNEDFNNRHAS